MTAPDQNYPQKPRALQPPTRAPQTCPDQTSFDWLRDELPATRPPSIPPAPKPYPAPAPPRPQPRPAALIPVVAAAATVYLSLALPSRAIASSLPDATDQHTPAAAARGLFHRPQERIAARQQAFLECHLQFGCRLNWLRNQRDARVARRLGNPAPDTSPRDASPRPFRSFLLRIRFPVADHDPPTRLHRLRQRRTGHVDQPPERSSQPPPPEFAPLAPPAAPRPRFRP